MSRCQESSACPIFFFLPIRSSVPTLVRRSTRSTAPDARTTFRTSMPSRVANLRGRLSPSSTHASPATAVAGGKIFLLVAEFLAKLDEMDGSYEATPPPPAAARRRPRRSKRPIMSTPFTLNGAPLHFIQERWESGRGPRREAWLDRRIAERGHASRGNFIFNSEVKWRRDL